MDNKNNTERKADELLCDIIFQKNKAFNKAKLDDQIELLNFLVERLKRKHVPYDSITRRVFGILGDVKDVEKVCSTASQKLNAVDANKKNDEHGYKYVSDFQRHIELSKIQKIAIMEESFKASDIANEAEKTLKEVSAEFNSVNDVKSKIYTDFISILGIFTAITFATFGGLQLLGNVFGQNASRDIHALGSALVLGSLYIYGTYLLLLALLTGIHKLMRVNNYDKKKKPKDEVNDTVKAKTKIKDILKDNDDDYHYSKKLMALISVFCLIMLVVGLLLAK